VQIVQQKIGVPSTKIGVQQIQQLIKQQQQQQQAAQAAAAQGQTIQQIITTPSAGTGGQTIIATTQIISAAPNVHGRHIFYHIFYPWLELMRCSVLNTAVIVGPVVFYHCPSTRIFYFSHRSIQNHSADCWFLIQHPVSNVCDKFYSFFTFAHPFGPIIYL